MAKIALPASGVVDIGGSNPHGRFFYDETTSIRTGIARNVDPAFAARDNTGVESWFAGIAGDAYLIQRAPAGGGIAWSEFLKVSSAGNIGVGTAPQQRLTFASGAGIAMDMAPPGAPTGTPENWGSMAAGTYYYSVVAVDANGGKTTRGTESAGIVVTGAGNGSVKVRWPVTMGAVAYELYRTTTSGSYSSPSFIARVIARLSSPAPPQYEDLAASPSAGAPPSSTTAFTNLIASSLAPSWHAGGERRFTGLVSVPAVKERLLRKSFTHRCGVLIPYYEYPLSGGDWSPNWKFLMLLLKRYHMVPTMIIINPGSGPGSLVDSAWTQTIRNFQGAGAVCIGYIWVDYTVKPAATVKAEVDTWLKFYPEINGIFWDGMTNDDVQAHRDYFRDITDYCHQRGLYPVVGNPGANTYNSYFEEETSDIIVVHENSVQVLTETVLKDPWGHGSIPYERRAGLFYGQATLDRSVLALFRKYYGLIYITDDNVPNPWDAISTYLEDIYLELAQTQPEIMTMLTSGNVGLGTTNPQQRLTLAPGSNLAVELAAPPAPTGTPGSAGSMATGTYYYRITTMNETGETVGGPASTGVAVTGPTGSVALSWTAVGGATSYKVYRTTTVGQFTGTPVFTTPTYIANPTANNYTDTAASPSAGVPPQATTAYVNRLAASGDSFLAGGGLGIGMKVPTARLHLAAGVATANGAPLKLIAGTNLTSPEAGAIEFDGTDLYFTTNTPVRKTLLTSPVSYLVVNGGLDVYKGTQQGTLTDAHVAITDTGANARLIVGQNFTNYAQLQWIYNATPANAYLELNIPQGQPFFLSPKVGIGLSAPTARLHLAAGVAAANGAPLKLTSGTNLTTPEAGAMEFDGTNLMYTTNAGARKILGTTGGIVSLAEGGTGAALVDPNVDRILFWDDSAGTITWLATGNSISITTTTIDTIQDIRTSASPTFVGCTMGNLGLAGNTLSSSSGHVVLSPFSGNVGVGDSTPNNRLVVVGGLNVFKGTQQGNLTDAHVAVTDTGADSRLLLGQNYTDYFQIKWIYNATPSNAYCEFFTSNGQKIITTSPCGVGTATPDAKAILDVYSTTKGFLPPRLSSTQRNDITSPPAGLMIFNTTTTTMQVYNGTAWVDM